MGPNNITKIPIILGLTRQANEIKTSYVYGIQISI